MTPYGEDTVHVLAWNHGDPNVVHHLNAAQHYKTHVEEGSYQAAMARHPAGTTEQKMTAAKSAIHHANETMESHATMMGARSTANKTMIRRPKGQAGQPRIKAALTDLGYAKPGLN